MFFLKFIAVCASAFIFELVWTYTIRRTAEGKALQAATSSSLTTVLSGVMVYLYVQQITLLAAAALGVFVGNYCMIRLDTRKPHPEAKKLNI